MFPHRKMIKKQEKSSQKEPTKSNKKKTPRKQMEE